MDCWSQTAYFKLRAATALAVVVSLTSCRTGRGLPSYGVVPDFALTEQTGAAFGGKALDGKVWIADFIFTNCAGPCPRMSSQMRKVQQQLAGTGVEFVSFTVDPDRDTPEVLAAYARRFQADTATWHFLTGPKETLHHLNRKVFLLGDITPELDHSTRFVLVDRKSRIRGYYTTSQPDETEKLVADARSLLD